MNLIRTITTSIAAGLVPIFRSAPPAWNLYPRWLRRSLIHVGAVRVSGIMALRIAPMMGGSEMMEALHFAKGIDPIADAFAGTVRSDIYNMGTYDRALFVIYVGVGATGTSVITVNSCDDTVPSTRTAIPFWYREITATDVEGAISRATASGFTTTAGSSKIVLVEVAAQDLADGHKYVELQAVESVNNPVLGGVHVMLGAARYKEDVKPTVLT